MPDLSKTGQYPLTFTHNGKEETVTLTVQDTTASTAKFQDVVVDIDTVVKPEQFVTEVSDLSETTLSFAAEPDRKGSDTASVEVVVTDAAGNKLTGVCKVTYLWMYETFTLELGNQLQPGDVLLNPERDAQMIDQKELDKINKGAVGEYTLHLKGENREGVCTVTVQDTQGPTLVLRTVNMDLGESLSVSKFVKTCTDASGKVTPRFVTKPDITKEGTQTVTIEAVDKNGNKTTAKATLKIHQDSKPPVFSGIKAMTVKKDSTPNFRSGVTCRDAKDGVVEFTVDTSKVNLGKSGTYYAVYTAKDSAGNKATVRRKITVTHSDADVKALVKSIADKLPNDPEKIRDYIRNSISYSSSWGGSDPVWYGFKNKVGNCYVHAMCLQAIFREKGIQTQLIWCTDKTHYWNLVYINGGWKHIDSTPGNRHTKYSLMNDEQRYERLQGRDWDRTKWPACN